MKKNPIFCATFLLTSTTLLSAGPSSFNAGLTYESLKTPSQPKTPLKREKETSEGALEKTLKSLLPDDKNKVFVVKNITVQDKAVDNKIFQPVFDKYVGQEMSMGRMGQLKQDLTAALRNHGFIFSRVVIPPPKSQPGKNSSKRFTCKNWPGGF